jgi:hypothetical protein
MKYLADTVYRVPSFRSADFLEKHRSLAVHLLAGSTVAGDAGWECATRWAIMGLDGALC